MFRKDETVTEQGRIMKIPTEEGVLEIAYDELSQDKQKALDFLEMRRVEVTELARSLRLGMIDVEQYDNEMRIIVNSIEKEAQRWE